MKYKINRDQEPLTDGELSSARNFNNIYKGYNAMKIPFYRRGRFLTRGSAIIVAVAVTMIVLFDDKAETPEKKFISPPFAQITIPLDSFTVDADSTTDIDYKSGSKLHIPAGAFRDAQGNLVKGKVILSYREFHDQKDIFLSGIPMTYDSAGVQYVFESAGMMQIGATQNGKTLVANSDNPIKVDMVSNSKEDRYNTYYLDTASKKWINLNQANLDPEQFNKFAKSDKTHSKFHIDIDLNEFPEIAMYKGVKFQVKDEAHYDKSSTKIQWEDVKLKKLNGMDYEVTFTKGNKTFKVVATPVIDDKDLAGAQKVYDKKFADYQAKLKARIEAEKRKKKELDAYQAKLAAQEAGENGDLRKTAAFQEIEILELEQQEAINRTGTVYADVKNNAGIKQTDLVFRTFVVANFGVYNADYSYSWPSGGEVIASFKSEKGDKLDLSCVYMVNRGINIVYPFYGANGECTNFKFDKSKSNVLWAVTKDNRLVVVDINTFKACQVNGNKMEFKFKMADKEFKNSDEVKKYLDI